MQYPNGTVSILHALQEARDGFLVVRGCEGSRKVETERPGGRETWFSGHSDVVLESFLHCATTDDEVLEGFSTNADADLGGLFVADFEVDWIRMD